MHQDSSQDLSFARHHAHRGLLRDAVLSAHADREVKGLMVSGSVARGDAHPGSDLDLFVLLKDGIGKSFDAEVRDGVVVEVIRTDFYLARERLEDRPMEVYRYLDGRVLYDPEDRLAVLADNARKRFEDYRTTEREKERLAYWLRSARTKAIASREAGDSLRASFVVSTSSWQILEALWAANDRPMPPGGSVFAHLRDLSRTPPDLERGLRELFLGNARGRVDAAIGLMDGTVELLRGAAPGPQEY